MISQPKEFLRNLFNLAIKASLPTNKLHPYPQEVAGRTVVLGAGKAAASMAVEFENNWTGDLAGLVITRYGHSAKTQKIKVVEASHPVPDENGINATKEIINLAKSLTKDDQLIFLGSGGASSLLVAPCAGITLADKININQQLLNKGVPITQMNHLRQSLSAIKGGRLAALAHPAKVISYLISDVAKDDPAIIGSGPTVYNDFEVDVFAILKSADIKVTEDIKNAIINNPKPKDLHNSEIHLIIKAMDVLNYVKDEVSKLGYDVNILGDDIEGEAKEVAKEMAQLALKSNNSIKKNTIFLSGGETSVKVSGQGKGGRNQEFLLNLALELKATDGIYAISCDTDGIDGNSAAAGAMIYPTTLAKLVTQGLDPKEVLQNNNANFAFSKIDALITTGPTLTNVNDFRAIVIEAK